MRDDDDLPLWVLIQTSHVAARVFGAVFASAGLTPTQFGVLNQLDRDAGVTQADLARRVLVRPQSMGELVASLLERGLVARTGPGGRGRRTGLTLTPAGRGVLNAGRPLVEQLNAPDALGLTDQQAQTLVRLLRAVSRALEQRAPSSPAQT